MEMYIVREGEARLNKRRKGEQKKLTRINEAGILFWGQWVGRLLILGQVPQMPITLLLLFCRYAERFTCDHYTCT